MHQVAQPSGLGVPAGAVGEIERNLRVEPQRQITRGEPQRNDARVVHAEVNRQLTAEDRPAVRKVRGRQHGDGEPALGHAPVNLGDEHAPSGRSSTSSTRDEGRLSAGSK